MRTVEIRLSLSGKEVLREVMDQTPCDKYEIELPDDRAEISVVITDWRWDGTAWEPIQRRREGEGAS